MSQIDLNHSREMTQYNYFAHPSPIDEPGNAFKRLFVNPAINDHWSAVAENIAAGYATAAQATYIICTRMPMIAGGIDRTSSAGPARALDSTTGLASGSLAAAAVRHVLHE
jgi:hypothetical protein